MSAPAHKRNTLPKLLTQAASSIFRRRPNSASYVHDGMSDGISGITLEDIQGARHHSGGGFGSILVLEHPTAGKVALKQWNVSQDKKGDALRRVVLREKMTWEALEHPNVLPCLGILESPTDLYLVSPYVENGSLADYLHQHPEADREQFLVETASAIAYIHTCGIVHGDIKPYNILVSDDIHALVCDFGIARLETTITSDEHRGLGTIRFQSPELFAQGGGKTFASDTWAFGMTIYQVLSGHIPFHDKVSHIAVIIAIMMEDERPPKIPTHSPSGHSYRHLWAVAERCWCKDPAARPSMQEAHRALRPDRTRQMVLRGHTDKIKCLSFSPDGQTIVSGSYDRTLRLWDAESADPQGKVLMGHTGYVSCVQFSPDGRIMVSGASDDTLQLWGAKTRNRLGEALKGHTEAVSSVAFSPDGRTIVSGSDDCTLRLWDVESAGRRGKSLKGHTDWVKSVAFSPDATTVVSGSGDHTVRLWDVESGRQRGGAMKGHTDWVRSVAFSPDGRTVVSGSDDCTLRLWDVETGSQRGEELKGHTSWIWSVAFSPDGRLVASGSDDHTVRLWDASSGIQRGEPLKGHTDAVYHVAFLPDGETVVSASWDDTLRTWDLSS